jgi:hypothetical protein
VTLEIIEHLAAYWQVGGRCLQSRSSPRAKIHPESFGNVESAISNLESQVEDDATDGKYVQFAMINCSVFV